MKILSIEPKPTRPVLADARLRNVATNEAGGFTTRYKHLIFMVSEAQEADGNWWRHGSVSRRDRTMPTYQDLLLLKQMVFGDDKKAIQVFPPASEHEDFAGKAKRPIQVLHLWSCTSADVLPDFRMVVHTSEGKRYMV